MSQFINYASSGVYIVDPDPSGDAGQRLNGNFKKLVDLIAERGTPTGALLPFGGGSPPAGWLLCDGDTVSRTVYAALFAVIGETFGTGDGSTTFQLPDLRGRFPLGADGATYPIGMPGGSFSIVVNTTTAEVASGTDASPIVSATIDDSPQPFQAVNYIIKT